MNEHERWMEHAITLAEEARARGDHPFGAVLTVDGALAATARNAVITTGDVTQHAELRLVASASRDPAVAVSRSVLYTSTEPCAMCCGAIFWAGIRHVVFGLPAAQLEAEAGGPAMRMAASAVLANAVPPVRVDGPVLEERARLVHEGFW